VRIRIGLHGDYSECWLTALRVKVCVFLSVCVLQDPRLVRFVKVNGRGGAGGSVWCGVVGFKVVVRTKVRHLT
jgi:hypothetical protein